MANEQEKKVEEIVRKYLFNHSNLISNIKINDANINHVIRTGTDLLLAKWGLHSNVGGFVESILKNDLMNTYNRADSINEHFIKFYLMLIYNTSKPEDL